MKTLALPTPYLFEAPETKTTEATERRIKNKNKWIWKQHPVVTDVCFKDNKTGKRLKVVPLSGIVTVYAKTENTKPGDIVRFSIKLENGKTISISDKVNRQGFIEIKDFNIYKE